MNEGDKELKCTVTEETLWNFLSNAQIYKSAWFWGNQHVTAQNLWNYDWPSPLPASNVSVLDTYNV